VEFYGFTFWFLAFGMVDNIASSIAETQGTSTPSQKQQWCELGLHNYIKMFIIGGLFYYLFRKEFPSIVQTWINDRSWSHGFLILPFSLYLLDQHRSKVLNLRAKSNYLGLVFLVCVLLFYFLNLLSPSGYAYFRRISIIAALGAVVLFLGGWGLIQYTWLPVAFLLFAVPLPRRSYVSLSMPLQKLAAAVAAPLLDLVPAIEAGATGVLIFGVYKGQDFTLNVEEACAGMRLLIAFVALGVAMAYVYYRPMWQRIILVASAIPIAVFCNMVRVTTTGFIYVFVGPEYIKGVYHDALGLTMLPLAFALLYFLAWFMSSLFVEESREVIEDIIVRRRGT
jgi:exosortase